MKSRGSEGSIGLCKCDVVLREVLKSRNSYTDAAEAVFNGDFAADAAAFQLYEDLLALISDYGDSALAEGAGDLRLPAAPRYTECGITRLGIERLQADR